MSRASNLLRFNLPITQRHSSTPPTTLPIAQTLWGCGGSHKFVHPDLLSRLRKSGHRIKSRSRRHMNLTTAAARRRERLPLHEAQLLLNMGGYKYTGWFVLYKLAKYDIILGKN